jgi:hypothetical protein
VSLDQTSLNLDFNGVQLAARGATESFDIVGEPDVRRHYMQILTITNIISSRQNDGEYAVIMETGQAKTNLSKKERESLEPVPAVVCPQLCAAAAAGLGMTDRCSPDGQGSGLRTRLEQASKT